MWVAAAIAIAVVVFIFRFGAPVAGGSDSYGYVSQAHLWATGRMSDELPLTSELVPVVQARVLVPLAYHLAADQKSMVASYASGLPLTMAVFERLAGPRAVFWVVPLLGGLAVWSTYLLGCRAGGPLAGAVAATLLAASPAFLFQAVAAPMSDLPAAAWWTLTLALLFVDRAWAAPVAGLAAALAVLTRPNLVPVALVPLLLSTWRAIDEERSAGGEDGRRRAAATSSSFAGGVAVASLAVAAINTRLFGSPLSSGYDVRGLFALEHARPNLVRYPILLTEMHTPLVWLAALAPWLAGRRAALRERRAPARAGRPPRERMGHGRRGGSGRRGVRLLSLLSRVRRPRDAAVPGAGAAGVDRPARRRARDGHRSLAGGVARDCAGRDRRADRRARHIVRAKVWAGFPHLSASGGTR